MKKKIERKKSRQFISLEPSETYENKFNPFQIIFLSTFLLNPKRGTFLESQKSVKIVFASVSENVPPGPPHCRQAFWYIRGRPDSALRIYAVSVCGLRWDVEHREIFWKSY